MLWHRPLHRNVSRAILVMGVWMHPSLPFAVYAQAANSASSTLSGTLSPSLNRYDVWALCEQADRLLMESEVAGAKKTLETALHITPDDYEVLHRLARTYTILGDMEQNNAKRATLYQNAKQYAERAIERNAEGMWAYIRRAIVVGKIALAKNPFEAKDLVMSVKHDLERAIALNNAGSLPLSIAHYVLGRAHFTLSEVPAALRAPLGLDWGSLEEALLHLRTSISLRPEFIMYRLDYARALLKTGKRADAQRELEMIAFLQHREYGDDERRQEARRLLQELLAMK